MPPKPARPRIAIVGAGSLASALAMSLRGSGFAIDLVISRETKSSLLRARRLARKVGATAVTVRAARISADLVWFCVPDGVIQSAAESLAKAANWKGKVALHSSGALASDELRGLRKLGAAVASVHPMMTFVRQSQPTLLGVSFAIEGDVAAVRMARRIVKDLGGEAYSIRREQKPAYHAWGTFASPLLTALLATGEHVAARAGVKGKRARQRMLPILRQTLDNYAALGAPRSFSGPIIRGDIDTVKRHLRTLSGAPIAQEVYVALASAALAHLPAKKKTTIEMALQSLGRSGSRIRR